jgi:hypothetical protein
VAQNWMEDGLYGDVCVVVMSLFYNYQRRALKKWCALTNVGHLLLEGGDVY